MIKISTKGRYALRMMIDLAQHRGDGVVTLREVAERQNISLRYLELISAMLKKTGLIVSMRGKGGGYRLSREPHEYTVGEILRLTEGTCDVVACMSGEIECPRMATCTTLPFWRGLREVIEKYMNGTTLEDLMSESCDPKRNYGAGI